MIVLCIVILFSVVFYWGAYNKISSIQTTPIDTGSISSCTEKILANILSDLAFQGGYLTIDEKYSTIWGDVPIYTLNKNVPTEDELKTEFELEAASKLLVCITPNMKKQEGDIIVESEFNNNQVRAVVNYPVSIAKGAYEQQLSPVPVKINSRILVLQKAADSIIKAVGDNLMQVPTVTILDIEEKDNLLIDALWDQENILYFISDKDKISQPLVWVFAVRK